MNTSPQGCSTKITMSSENVSPASSALEMDTSFHKFLLPMDSKTKKCKDNREKQKKITIYDSHNLWTMAGQPPLQTPRDKRYKADQPCG